MLDLGKAIRRKSDKTECRVLATDLPGENAICIAYPGHCKGWWYSHTMTPSDANRIYENLPERVRGWVNVYRRSYTHFPAMGHIHPSKEYANGDIGPGDRIGCIFVDFTEGDGL